ncbi:MAG TPA: isoamylase early set domain-containing protein [Gemmatimonadaceae bacterium]|nr:isoamylase early set domain-containing protein [Gemmatimonadaceae bacterium]
MSEGGRDVAREGGMFEEHDDRAFVERIAKPLRADAPLAADFMSRLDAAVRADSRIAGRKHQERGATAPWWQRRVTLQLSLSPVVGLALAAGLATVAVLGAVALRAPGGAGAAVSPTAHPVATALAPARTDTVHIVRFVFIAPGAASVALVGDFNNWQRTATLLRHTGSDGIWTVSVPMSRGVHQYAFVINGTRWVADPAAGTTVTDDFGTTTSVVTVGSGASS